MSDLPPPLPDEDGLPPLPTDAPRIAKTKAFDANPPEIPVPEEDPQLLDDDISGPAPPSITIPAVSPVTIIRIIGGVLYLYGLYSLISGWHAHGF